MQNVVYINHYCNNIFHRMVQGMSIASFTCDTSFDQHLTCFVSQQKLYIKEPVYERR